MDSSGNVSSSSNEVFKRRENQILGVDMIRDLDNKQKTSLWSRKVHQLEMVRNHWSLIFRKAEEDVR
ncbi:hypothetical protein GCK72_001186 [Caenorhabditis remanei]|uniref:Uncharacterized protein n=1 Tax=Caenorhabditis remanei TaxID=31234 RepID=A0A6A5HNY7_CAERE|nr:hypothetical protein GCK72_001186 [Caenorhabditis remanei]KAF1769369.1 hypothetical protein GCK72_001186 [Caenorhabditis remanei]